jgi:hypothetical protein
MLVMMLFRLSVEMKAKRIGIQLAVGWSPGLVTKTLLAEGFLLSVIGSLFGALLGIFYAWLMVYGLTTWWVDAVTVPFLTLYINPASLVIGFASGVMLSALTIFWSIRGVARVPLRGLLHGEVSPREVLPKQNKGITIKIVLPSFPFRYLLKNKSRNGAQRNDEHSITAQPPAALQGQGILAQGNALGNVAPKETSRPVRARQEDGENLALTGRLMEGGTSESQGVALGYYAPPLQGDSSSAAVCRLPSAVSFAGQYQIGIRCPHQSCLPMGQSRFSESQSM